ncbi:zinc-binding dehydrogenase [Sphingopyxis sp. A083]|uniref:zinc-binding dehydrogenase n=1 Tax=Sphingopyxis sp. A083 TaxID=1759083 RepID=UPI0007365977|nr:zinc-binding dehydrogenase [Sphingopyxis sp. A083]KTE77730.1 hypothetical protein ATE59_06060 [Sphingopyxis sp. A083]
MGAHIAYAIDPVAERRVLAEEAGAIALHPGEAVEMIREATKGRKPDCAIAVFERDETVDLALRLVRARDTVSVIGVQQSRRYAFPLELFCSGPDVQGWDVLGPRGASHPVPAGAGGTPAAREIYQPPFCH